MAHVHDWEVCKKSGKLRHKCKPEDVEIQKHEHRKEPFVTYHYCDPECGIEPPPPPSIPKLDPNISYHKTGKLVTAFFNKGGLFLKNNLPHHSDQNYKDYIDTIARENLANNIRMFLWWVDNPAVNAPFVKVNGKFDLHRINPVWRDQVKWRVEYAAERDIPLRLIDNDQSSLRYFNQHWINPDNNHGWDGKPTYWDRHGWWKWVWYSYEPNERCDEECTERYATTRDFLFHFKDQLIKLLEPYRPIWENNEADAGDKWNVEEANFKQSRGIPRNRRITSVRGEEWLATKPNIARKWIPEIHGINTVQLYEDAKEYEPSCPWLPSGDGFGEGWNSVGNAEICNVLLKSLRDGNLGYTGNTEGLWDDMDWSTAKAMMKSFRGWLGL